MGIADRHYVREGRPRGGGFGGGGPGGPPGGLLNFRMWSVTTWLIVVTVAVFMIDGFLPTTFVWSGQIRATDAVRQGLDRDQMVIDTSAEAVDRVYRATGRIEAPVYPFPGADQPVAAAPVIPMKPIEAVLHFSTYRGFQKFEFWRLIGFQFLHSRSTIWHLAFNMLGLFFFGPMVERRLGSKRYLAFYLLCGICGALMYLTLNFGGFLVQQSAPGMMIPGLLFNSPATPLIGASAGVYGVLMAGAYIAPRAKVLIFFILPIELKYLAYILVGVSLLTIFRSGPNAGGEAAHLGGAIAGFYFIRRPHHLHGFFDLLGRADPTSHHYRQGRPRPAAAERGGGPARPGPARPSRRDRRLEAEVDRILDKIRTHPDGVASLTDRERRILNDASSNL